MLNLEQVERLTQSIEHWNQWRHDNPNIQPNLSYADLSHADLRHANLLNALQLHL